MSTLNIIYNICIRFEAYGVTYILIAFYKLTFAIKHNCHTTEPSKILYIKNNIFF